MASLDTQITIIGMGPTGAFLAALLADLGIDSVVVERDTGLYSYPRAVQIDHEILRLLNLVGVAEEVSNASQPVHGYEFVSRERELLMGFYPLSELAPTGYAWNNLFHQPSLETALRSQLRKRGNVTTLEGAELQSVEQDDLKVSAEVKLTDELLTIRSCFLVGCDGARSTVRQLLDIRVDDLGFDEPWLVIDTLLADTTGTLSDKGLQLCDPARPTTSMPAGPGRHRWEFMLLPGESEKEISADSSVRALLAPWIDVETISIERTAVYHFHALFAERWSQGRVFLAGDAAHQMPPFMGQGLCSGVRDAANLAWKLAAVLGGHADSQILHALQHEREPQIREITAMAIDMGKLVCTVDADEAYQRDKDLLAQPLEQRRALVNGVANINTGVLTRHGGGAILPEPFIMGVDHSERLDNTAGYNCVVIIRALEALDQNPLNELTELISALPNTCLCSLESRKSSADEMGLSKQAIPLLDLQENIASMLGEHECLLARPDRVVFGVGAVSFIVGEWRAYLSGQPC